ncbi:MAG: FAD-binding protein [Polyangiaceae bacterium]
MSAVLVIGGGVPGLSASVALAERGVPVILMSATRAASVPHFPEGGFPLGEDIDALATAIGDVPGARDLAAKAGAWVERLLALGVPFAREGRDLLRRRLEGHAIADAVHVDARTASQIAWALDRELMRHEAGGAKVTRRERHALVDLVVDDAGRVVGALLEQRITGKREVQAASAVVLTATGPHGAFAGPDAASHPEAAIACGLALGASARVAPARLHPLLLAHGRRAQPLSSALRAEGLRLWIPEDGKEARIPRDIPPSDRDHFLERDDDPQARQPLLERDEVVARQVWRAQRRGIHDRRAGAARPHVYAEIAHLPEGHLAPKVGRELTAIAARSPRDPHAGPFEVKAGAAAFGITLEVDASLATTVPGLYALTGVAARAGSLQPAGGVALLAALDDGERLAEALASVSRAEPAAAALEGAMREGPQDEDDPRARRAALAASLEIEAFEGGADLDLWREQLAELPPRRVASAGARALRNGLELALATHGAEHG